MEEKTYKKENGIKAFVQFSQKWLIEHFGAVLGENAVLSKAITLLFTAFVFYFNYLKHQYDVGYYHEVFCVPKEYLGSAWNSTISDFILLAVFTLIQSMLAFVFMLILIVILFFACWLTAKQFSTENQFATSIFYVSLAIIVYSIFTGPIEPWLKLLASLYVTIWLAAIVILVLDSYKKTRNEEIVNSHTSNDSQDDCATAYTVMPHKWKSVLILIVAIMFIISGGFSKWLGRKMADDERSMKYISIEEGIPQQLNELIKKTDDLQENDYWAIIFQLGENYIIAPCTISNDTSTATVYTKYQCIIPTEGVVVASGVFSNISIDRRLTIVGDNWGLFENEVSEPIEIHNPTNPIETNSTINSDEDEVPTASSTSTDSTT